MPYFTTDLSRRLRSVFASLALCIISSSALAHEGHDHGTPQATAAAKSSPRVSAQSEAYELVGILQQDTLRLYLDRFETNEPVTDASIVVTVGGVEDLTASREGDGTFGITSGKFQGEGPLELVFVITAPSGGDLLIGMIDLPARVLPQRRLRLRPTHWGTQARHPTCCLPASPFRGLT